MQLAFYAPLKPPAHPVPSGDRAMARGLIGALEHLGAQVTLASELRSRDGAGDDTTQKRISDAAEQQIPGLVRQGRQIGWTAWITYHCYYKAPDLIGPKVAKMLGIPYLLIEATRARKRLGGPWDRFAKAAEAACDAANVIFYLTERDRVALQAYAPPLQKHLHLRPFMPRTQLPNRAKGGSDGPLLAVGMMREAAKLSSYRLIAETLVLLPSGTRLEIAGDGPARSQVEDALHPVADRVTYLGELTSAALADVYERAGALIWPGVDEAFGMTYLEAQAHGLPVIAQDRPGVRDVLYPRQYPGIKDGAPGLAAFAQMAPPAADDIRAYVAAHHLLPAAAQTLRNGLMQAGVS